MKYYLYISDAKVDMLYPQIPKTILEQIVGDLHLDIEIPGIHLMLTTKKEQSPESRYAKVKIVSTFIEEHYRVGSIDNPGKSWFAGKMLMSWSPVTDSEAVFFGGRTKNSYVGLGGSLKHIIGNNTRADVSADFGGTYGSQTPQLIDILNKRYHVPPPKDPDERIILTETVWYAQDVLAAMPKQHMEFLALKYCHDTVEVGEKKEGNVPSHVVLGTPLYVALSE